MKKLIIALSAIALPVFAYAQLGNVENIATSIGNIINLLIPIVFALALLYFFWGLATYILSSGDPEKKEEGRNKMIWGIVALFVMASIWGLVNFLQDALDIDEGTGPAIIIPGVGGE